MRRPVVMISGYSLYISGSLTGLCGGSRYVGRFHWPSGWYDSMTVDQISIFFVGV